MKLILEMRHHGDDVDAQHFAFTKFPVSIGRGFDNDIILNDPYVSPRHLHIEYDGETCIANDYGSENGFTVNGQSPSGRRASLKSGDALHIGQTEIRIYKPEHPVAAAAILQKGNPIFDWVTRPLNVWACFVIAVAITLCWSWLEIWSEEEGLALAGAALGTIGVIVIWSAIWSVAGRLTHHKAHFKGHVALICLYLIAGTVAWYIVAYIDFLTNENWFSHIATYGINFVMLAFLLYGSFALATKMRRRRRIISAGFFSFGLMAGIVVFTLVSIKSFNQQPIYPSTLEPFLAQLVPANTVNEYMDGNDRLFASDEFTQDKATPPAASKDTPAKN